MLRHDDDLMKELIIRDGIIDRGSLLDQTPSGVHGSLA